MITSYSNLYCLSTTHSHHRNCRVAEQGRAGFMQADRTHWVHFNIWDEQLICYSARLFLTQQLARNFLHPLQPWISHWFNRFNTQSRILFLSCRRRGVQSYYLYFEGLAFFNRSILICFYCCKSFSKQQIKIVLMEKFVLFVKLAAIWLYSHIWELHHCE